jgi:hypothetical protein
MSDLFPRAEQRFHLVKLLEALDARQSSLRRDECNDWTISGTRGNIYAGGRSGRGPGTLRIHNIALPS